MNHHNPPMCTSFHHTIISRFNACYTDGSFKCHLLDAEELPDFGGKNDEKGEEDSSSQ